MQSPLAAAQSTAVPAWRQAANVAVLPIHGPIDSVTATSLQRRLDQAVADGAEAIVFEIDTPGGEVMATLEICRMIKYDAPDNTVAWIHPFAFSAGTIIALACREIVVSPDSTFGDSAPISALGPIPQTERAKMEAPILTEVIDSARRRHYDEQLVQAFVSVGVELWLLRNDTTGQIVFVDSAEYERLFGEPPTTELIKVAAPTPVEGFAVSPFFEKLIDPASAMQGSTPPEDSIAFTQLLPSSRLRLDSEHASDWAVVKQVTADDRLLTLKPAEGVSYGLVADVVPDSTALQGFFGASSLRVYRQSWSESLVQFLISWPARIVLIIVFLVCIFVEMALPGTGLFAAGSILALALLIGAPALAGLAQWWDLLAVVMGIGLIAVELALVPGTLIAGVSGAVLLMIGLIGTFVSGDMSNMEMQNGIVRGFLVILVGSFLSMIVIWVLARYIDHDQLGHGFILRAQAGGVGTAPPQPTPGVSVEPGQLATAATALRPAGRIRIDDRLLDAVSLGRWVEAGAKVRVIRTGMVLEVEAVDT